jgi:hypothetical protein
MLKNDAIDRISQRVIGCAIEVHRTMGPGLLESRRFTRGEADDAMPAKLKDSR